MASVRFLYSAVMLLVLDMVLCRHHREGRHQFPQEYEAHYQSPARHRVSSRVSYDQPREIHVTHDVRHVVVKKKKRRRKIPHHHVPVPVPVPVDPVVQTRVAGFDGSYAAVSGIPGRGSVHLVESVPALVGQTVHVLNGVRVASPGYNTRIPHPVVAPIRPVVRAALPVVPVQAVVQAKVPVAVQPVLRILPQQPGLRNRILNQRPRFDSHPLPKCSYINTDFVGNDLDENNGPRGVIAGSARACKALCHDEDDCYFWTYREGRTRESRDCFLKEGTPGKPVPDSAVPRVGYVSGTKDNNCPCITSATEEDEVCPIKNPGGSVYPFKDGELDESLLGGLGGLGVQAGLGGIGRLPQGWTSVRVKGDPAGIYTRGTLDPRLTGILGTKTGVLGTGIWTNTGVLGTNPNTILGTTGGRFGLEDEVRLLRNQLDVLTRRLALE